MERRQVIGLIGSALLVLGSFAPVVRVPLGGAITYFKNGQGDGLFTLIAGMLAAVLILARFYTLLKVIGLGCALLVFYDLYKAVEVMAKVSDTLKDAPDTGLAGSIVQIVGQSVGIEWGWGPLLLGALGVAVAGFMGSTRALNPRNMAPAATRFMGATHALNPRNAATAAARFGLWHRVTDAVSSQHVWTLLAIVAGLVAFIVFLVVLR
jgi:hypothetical protein